MQYLSRRPGPLLGAFVDYFWLLSDVPSHTRERILPSGTVELVINLREDEIRIYGAESPASCTRYAGAIVSGTYGRSFVIDTAQHASIMGVHFKPGGVFPFIRPPAGELADRHVDLADVWGRAAIELRERLCEATSADERFQLIERTLTSQARRPLARHHSVESALDALTYGNDASVREVAGRAGLSQRRFIQIFTAEVGLTPKLYQRIRRFRRMLSRVPEQGRPGWAELAVECGYYDQSHLIRDFRAFAGLQPTTYLRRRRVPVKEHHVAIA